MRLALLACLSSLVVAAQPLSPGALGQGELHAVLRDAQGKQAGPLQFSLEHTEVAVEVSGFLAAVTVTQTFGNPYSSPLEAIYVFPLPEQAAVDAMEIHLGGRVIRGVIKTREQARDTYEKAKAEGKTAALLDQERPNVFTQSVANILPGEKIHVTLHYVERLTFEAGGYQLDFPMTVGPRYMGGEPLATRQGEGTHPDTTTVPDASRLSPPVLPPQVRSGHDIGLTVRFPPGQPVEQVRSTSHEVSVSHALDGATRVELSRHDSIPNKTFTLQWRTAGQSIRAAALTHHAPGKDEGYLLLMLQPQLAPSDAEVVPRELYFVLDTSCSQSGAPIEKSKAIAREVLAHLRPEDTFQVLNFDTSVTKFAPAAVPATPENVERARAYVSTFWGGGGTDVNIAVQEAMLPPNDPARLRMVMFFTDGLIGGDDYVLGQLQKALRKQTRLFGVGVGNDVNRHLVRSMGELGNGSATFVNLRRPEEEVAREFEQRIRGPVLTSLSVDPGTLPLEAVYPQRLGDLFEGQALFLVAKYRGAGSGVVRISGEVRGQPRTFEVKVTLPEVEPANAALPSLWARQRIQELTELNYRGEQPEVVKAITETALEYSLMSKYTSFVAVEEVVRVDPSKTVTEAVPVELPEGTSYAGVFGELSREEIPPGDPLITVKAPKGARRVTAWFPFGLVKPLVYDRTTDAWRGRFLVPVTVKDGWYEVQVVVEHADGSTSRREVRYRLDSKAPDFAVSLEQRVVRPGGKLQVRADALEPTKELSVFCALFSDEQLLLDTRDQVHFTRTLEVPKGAKPGRYELVFVARDGAGNRFEVRQPFEVR
ncbi:MAG: VIT domain-containing protein [Myxococcota bacterium]